MGDGVANGFPKRGKDIISKCTVSKNYFLWDLSDTSLWERLGSVFSFVFTGKFRTRALDYPEKGSY